MDITENIINKNIRYDLEIISEMIKPKSKVLDLACGKGRHSLTLNELGFETLGVDLSPNSISIANESKKEGLSFEVHDMREVIEGRSFNAIFNLFTSFGYFDDLADNQRVCQSISDMLDSEGLLVIDFLNAQKVISNLVATETVLRGDIRFEIKRWATDGHIYKEISIHDPSQAALIGPYTERVQALRVQDFQALLAPNFELLETFGSYSLAAFDSAISERLILIAKKKP